MSRVDTAARIALLVEPIVGFSLPFATWYVTSGLSVDGIRYPDIYIFIGVACAFWLWFLGGHDAAIRRLS